MVNNGARFSGKATTFGLDCVVEHTALDFRRHGGSIERWALMGLNPKSSLYTQSTSAKQSRTRIVILLIIYGKSVTGLCAVA